ncbi:hypothetical protein GCM10010341_17330 [Streptomyces noursei]|nr:hypothetical protein GCM10010341_17330 [Streptomyces noursei]
MRRAPTPDARHADPTEIIAKRSPLHYSAYSCRLCNRHVRLAELTAEDARAIRRKRYLKPHKTVRGVYNGTVGGMSISPTCESPSAH